jgi:hypothetical protein
MLSARVRLPMTVAFLLLSSSYIARAQTEVRTVQVQVAAVNDEWTGTGVKVVPGDLVTVFASGNVKVGQMTGSVDADGINTNGTQTGVAVLQGKVGAAQIFNVGKRYAFTISEPGTFKLRLKDSRYDDNGGAFTVTIILVPAALIPAPVVYTGDD